MLYLNALEMSVIQKKCYRPTYLQAFNEWQATLTQCQQLWSTHL